MKWIIFQNFLDSSLNKKIIVLLLIIFIFIFIFI